MLRTSSLDELNERLLDEYQESNISRKLAKGERKLWNRTNNELGRKRYEH